MHLKWNQTERRFEAALGSGSFRADLEAVKAAGFKTDGAASGWIWYSLKALPLKWLRENRPPVLTIDADARAEYERLLPVEEKNELIKAQAAEAKKALKKALDADKKEGQRKKSPIPHKPDSLYDYIGAEDLPPMPPFVHKHIVTPPPDVRCFICNSPVYEYEYADGTKMPACLWCQKQTLDFSEVL